MADTPYLERTVKTSILALIISAIFFLLLIISINAVIRDNTYCNITYPDGTTLYAENIKYRDIDRVFPVNKTLLKQKWTINIGEYNGDITCKTNFEDEITTENIFENYYKQEEYVII